MKLHINWEAIGISAALACAIHCALLPLFISSIPLFGINFLNNLFFEAGMILTAIAIGGYTLWHGYQKHHHSIFPLLSFAAGMAFLIIKQFFVHSQFWLVIPAILFILLAHFFNWRLCRKAKNCHSSDCNH